MKKVFSNPIALTVLAATITMQAHAEVVVPEPQAPLTLEQQVQQNTTNIQTNSDDIVTNVYLNYESSVGIEKNADDIADINQRLNNSTPGSTPNADYRGFTLPFATASQPKNIIVLRRDVFHGGTSYAVRTRYENSENETVIINDSDRIYRYLATYGNIVVDPSGDFSYISKSIDAMNNTNYSNYSKNTTYYNPTTFEPYYNGDTTSDVIDKYTAIGPMRILTRHITKYNSGDITRVSNMMTRSYSLDEGYQANGIDFGNTPTRLEHRSEGGSRIRVKNIGIVELFGNGQGDSSKIIYYNVNGQTGGSLAGTPFETNSNLYNLFF